jgi:hypothetical protein
MTDDREVPSSKVFELDIEVDSLEFVRRMRRRLGSQIFQTVYY